MVHHTPEKTELTVYTWMFLKDKEKTTNLVKLFYSSYQVRVAGGVLKVNIV